MRTARGCRRSLAPGFRRRVLTRPVVKPSRREYRAGYGRGMSTSEPVTSDSSELRRIDFTRTVWFAAAAIGSGVSLAILVATGWRPTHLPAGDRIVWWVGAGLVVLGVAAFAWAGCPVLRSDVATADRAKAVCIRAGVALFLAGGIAATIASLLSPG
jgi:hypothetical protein